MSDQHEEERLRRWAREQADIERQIDALVVKALSSMVTAAADLKSKLKRDTDTMLDGYRRTKRSLESDISLSTAERLRHRREAEHERDAILAEARVRSREIVEAAEGERETKLTEVRAMEQRLRGLEGQIRTVLGLGAADETPVAREASAQSETTADAVPPTGPAEQPIVQASVTADDEVGPLTEADSELAHLPPFLRLVPSSADQPEPIPTTPEWVSARPGAAESEASPHSASQSSPATSSDSARVAAKIEALAAAIAAVRGAAADAEATGTADSAPIARSGAPATPSPAISQPSVPPSSSRPAGQPSGPRVPDAYRAASRPSLATPASQSAGPSSAPVRTASSARPAPVALVFSGVVSYQQASVLERAISDLLPDGEVDIVEFEGGQLQLSVRVQNLRELATQIVAAAPASLALDAVTDVRATFRCL